MKAFLNAFVLVLALVIFVYGLYQHRLLRESEVLNVNLARENGELLARLKEREKASEPPKRLPELEPAQKLDAASEAARMRALAKAKAADAIKSVDGQVRVLGNSEVQKAYFAQMKAGLPLHYKALYTKLGLSVSQVNQFEEILEKRFWAISDLVTTAAAQRLSRNDTVFANLYQQAISPTEEEIRQLLGGGDSYQQFTRYEQSNSVQGIVELLSGKAAIGAVPLTAQQLDDLQGVLVANSTRGAARPGAWIEANAYGVSSFASVGNPEEINWNASIEKLQSSLTEGQIAILVQVSHEIAANQEAKQTSKRLSQSNVMPTN